MTNSMVVKSSLWRRTRHRRGLAVRVFFSVATALSPPSRGFRLGIPGRSSPTPRRSQAHGSARGWHSEVRPRAIVPAHACLRHGGDRGDLRAAGRLRLAPARAGPPIRELQTGGPRQGDPLQRIADGKRRVPRARRAELQGAGHPVPRRQRGVVVPGALVQPGAARIVLGADLRVRLGVRHRDDPGRGVPLVPHRRREWHPVDRVRRAGGHATPGRALPHRPAAGHPVPRRRGAGPALRSGSGRRRAERPPGALAGAHRPFRFRSAPAVARGRFRLAPRRALCYKARAMSSDAKIKAELQRIEKGGAPKYHQKNAEQAKLFARERVRLLLDEGSFVEDGALANAAEADLPADGVITGLGKIAGRPVALMANDSTVKAGSWGRRTVEKIVRIQEQALKLRCPMAYLVDSAGARITDQLQMFPGRRGAGRIFYNQCQMSGLVPQLCLLFGPSAAGGAYIPAFCDIVVMVEGNASMYLGSPRMAEMVIGERVTLEEMGGAKMHTSVSGCGDVLVRSELEAIEFAKSYLAYFPENFASPLPIVPAKAPAASGKRIEEIIPPDQNKFFDMFALIRELIDADSLFEVKKLFAPEVITAFARIEGRPIGIVASQPRHKGGVLFVDSADKAARFIWLCDAFGIPLLYLADVPGFMIGTKVEREGIT